MDPELFSLDRLPLPSLRLYTFLSLLAASSSIYYVWTESDTAFKELAEQGRIGNNCKIIGELIPETGFVSKLGDSANSVLIESELVHENHHHHETIAAKPPRPSTMSMGLELISRYYAHANDYWWPGTQNVVNGETSRLEKNGSESECFNEGYQELTWQLLHWASEQPHCVWPLVNLIYCALILFSHSIQKSVFGNLRLSEQENIKDQFWNLVFYKVVFVFGVVNVQEVEDAIGWGFFVSVIGFLQLARQLCKERHNYLIMMNDVSKPGELKRHRILALLTFIFFTSVCLFLGVTAWFMSSTSKDFAQDFLDFNNIVPFMKPYDGEPIIESVGYDFNLGLHSAVFMLSEIGLLIIQTFHALTMCMFDQVYFRHRTSKWSPIHIFNMSPSSSENEEEDLYQCISQDINYKFEITSLFFDLIHHVHMLVCCNLFLSMTSLIVSLQMRIRVRQIHIVLKRRQSFTWLNEHIDRYADVKCDDDGASSEPIYNDNCAICWESVISQKSKILPCHHIFHKTCLRKWLMVSLHCPTCRLSLLSEKEAQLRREREPRRVYSPRPHGGLMGLLTTGQVLLDLFGGWDPIPDEYEGQPVPTNVPIFTDFSVPDWPSQVPSTSSTDHEPPPEEGPSLSTRKD